MIKTFQELIKDLYKLPIEDNFNLHIQKKYDYKFSNEEIKIKGFGYYDCAKPIQKQNKHRYYLELDIKNKPNLSTITTIMMNPSNTFPAMDNEKSKIDDTIKNVIRMAYRLGKYSKIVILNSFALIDGDGNNAVSDAVSQKKNLDIIEAYVKENNHSDYLLAWGKYAEDTDKIIKFLKSNKTDERNRVFAYRIAKEGYPCHPSKLVENSRKYISSFMNTHSENDSFEKYNI